MLILIRHGETAVNAGGRLQGRIDKPLTSVGQAQARSAAEAVGDVARVISSPLLRARQTAEAFGRPVEIDDRWTELDYGELDDTPMSEVPSDLWSAWRGDVRFRPPGGETLFELGERVREACDDLVADIEDRDVVVVSHVSPVKAAVAWALRVGDQITWHMFLDVAAITRIAVRGGRPMLTGFNDVAHLRRSPATTWEAD